MTTNKTPGELFTRSPAHPLTRSALGYLSWLALIILALALALLSLPTLALVSGLALAVALPLVDPIFGLYLVVLSVPVQELIHLPGGLSYTQAAMLLAVFGWALRGLAHPERRLRTGGWLFPLWAGFLWALLLAAALSPYSRAEGIKETLRWFEAFLVWLMAINLARRRWQIVGLIACLLLAPAAEAALGLAQFAAGWGPASFRIAPDLPFMRAYGTIGQPNSFAGYLNMAWPLALALGVGAATMLWRQKDELAETVRQGDKETRRQADYAARLSLSPLLLVSLSQAIGFWLLTGLLLAALVASLSRGAWVGAAAGALAMALALGPRARRWALAGVGIAALALALGGAGLLPGFVAARLASLTRYLSLFDAGTAVVTPENFAVVERMAQMQAGWRMFLAHPLTGVGPGSYTLAYPEFAVGTWYASRGHAHNYYLHMAAEAGIAGLLAYLALLAGLARQAIATLCSARGTFWRSVAIGCCGIIAAVAGHDLFENMHVLSMGVQLAAAWGLLAVLNDNLDKLTS